MKSAYELAMERLEKESGPSRKLSEAQKASIAEIDKKYEARIAEARLNCDNAMAAAASMPEVEEARAKLSSELQSLEQKREEEKNAVWDRAD